MTEPSSFKETVEDPAWVDATVEEYDSIVRNSAWEIVPRPEGKSLVGLRWTYKVKQAAEGSVEKYKARFVARGFSQIEGIDYEETFAPVARLKRALYGLKQAPRAWYTRIDSSFTGLGFSKSEADPYLYQIVVEGKLLIIVLYVDDLILTGDELLILSCKEYLAREFEMKDLGLLHCFLGLEIWQRSDGLFVSQGKYAREILEKFNMHGCKPVDTPLPGGWRKEDATSGEEVDDTVYRQLVGPLMYLVNTRPDICYAVNQLSQAMVKPTKLFWKAGKHVLRYLRGTSRYGLCRKQRFVALSSAEAEYMAASLAACEAIWMRKILVELFGSHLEPTVIYCDNQSCIKLSTNPVFHDISKHIDIRYHHIRDCVQRRIMLLSYIPTEDQDADILMKVLTRSKFEYHRGRIGVVDNP
eukprot:PITA_34538